MRKFEINITYSWGDKESPIEIERGCREDAFDYMINLATTEAKVSLESYEDYAVSIKIIPSESMIVLYYGYDNEVCYYQLKEIFEKRYVLVEDFGVVMY